MMNIRDSVNSAELENKDIQFKIDDVLFQRALLSDGLISLLVNVSQDRIVWYKNLNAEGNIHTI